MDWKWARPPVNKLELTESLNIPSVIETNSLKLLSAGKLLHSKNNSSIGFSGLKLQGLCNDYRISSLSFLTKDLLHLHTTFLHSPPSYIRVEQDGQENSKVLFGGFLLVVPQ